MVLHLEFQTEPDKKMGFRMLDYCVRIYRRFPQKHLYQVVIYLKPTRSPLAYQETFELRETRHQYRVIRLWEEPTEAFLSSPGLLPLALLTQVQEPTVTLRRVAQTLNQLEEPRVKSNLMTATAILGGLVMNSELIRTVLKSDILRESAFYQDILQEGLEEGRVVGLEEGREQGLQQGLQQGLHQGESSLLRKLL
ncbi:MAG: Rpn family recombination-promoting nuclease/putative transposase, partial [Microcystaceae cyanobacterium]